MGKKLAAVLYIPEGREEGVTLVGPAAFIAASFKTGSAQFDTHTKTQIDTHTLKHTDCVSIWAIK